MRASHRPNLPDVLGMPSQSSRANTAGAGGNTWELEIDTRGEFIRQPTEFHAFVSREPNSRFSAQNDRYHLYVSYACPWAHRTLVMHVLKGLESVVGISVVHPLLDARGWHFDGERDYGDTSDKLYDGKLLRERYDASVQSGRYTGRVTVPVLWDCEQETIVNNESAEIIRMLNSEFNEFARNPELDFYPQPLRAEIDELNDWIYSSVNNGVYRCGFATQASAYERAYQQLFAALDRLEQRLSARRYLTGPQLTEADIRLFTTLLRFDPVYHNHFRCNKKKLREYPNLWGFMLDVAQLPGVMSTIHLDHIKNHYYQSHRNINPSGIVPLGPDFDLWESHDRARRFTREPPGPLSRS